MAMEPLHSLTKFIHKIHLLTLPVFFLILVVDAIFILENKNYIFIMLGITFFPAIWYGKFWSGKISKMFREKKFPKKAIFYSPNFIAIYLMSVSFLSSLLIKKNLWQALGISLGVWASFGIFLKITLLFVSTQVSSGKNQKSPFNSIRVKRGG